MLVISIRGFLLDCAVLLLLNPYSGRFYFIESVLPINRELNIWDSFVACCFYRGGFASGENGLGVRT